MTKLSAPILYAEDNLLDLELALEAFKLFNLQHPVHIVRDGQELLDYLLKKGKYQSNQDQKPTFILLDNKMPKVSGLEALKVIKTDVRLKHIPIVMMTSSTLQSDIQSSYDLGVNAYVEKPKTLEEFISLIENMSIFWCKWNIVPYHEKSYIQ